jgi:hypothetical protein
MRARLPAETSLRVRSIRNCKRTLPVDHTQPGPCISVAFYPPYGIIRVFRNALEAVIGISSVARLYCAPNWSRIHSTETHVRA